MPTVLIIDGWRFFFYSNEGNEPIHIHCLKGDKECKYWLDREFYDVQEAFAFNMNNKDRRDVKKIIFNHFELIEKAWDDFQEKR